MQHIAFYFDHRSKRWICDRCGEWFEEHDPEARERHWEERHYPGISTIEYNEWLW